MRSSSPRERLLRAWEGGSDKPAAARGAALLECLAGPASAEPPPAALGVGRRDALLLQLRRQVFGPMYPAAAGCPRCGQAVEFSFEIDAVLAAADPVAGEGQSFSADEYTISYRDVTADDLDEAGGAGGERSARELLLRRCVRATRGQTPVDPAGLPDRVLDELLRRMQGSDPLADLRFNLSCPECGHDWPARFDVLTCLWRELEAEAARLLREVHALASAYGWSEDHILAMSDTRRQAYLELIGA